MVKYESVKIAHVRYLRQTYDTTDLRATFPIHHFFLDCEGQRDSY